MGPSSLKCVYDSACGSVPVSLDSVDRLALRPYSHATIFAMTRIEKVLEEVLRGTSDAGIRFEELRSLLARLGFEERSRGSHFVFTRAGIEDRIDLQRDGSHAKAYQVKQVRAVILKYHLFES